jgi:hypothetical protein
MQAHKALQHQVQDVTSAQLTSLSQELQQLRQRHDAAAAKAASEAAATRAQVAELRQWFDANQVCWPVSERLVGFSRFLFDRLLGPFGLACQACVSLCLCHLALQPVLLSTFSR